MNEAIRWRRKMARNCLMLGDLYGYAYHRQVLRQLHIARRTAKKRTEG